ncbi:hypothetical protein D3C76_1246580 [compost metagenome]
MVLSKGLRHAQHFLFALRVKSVTRFDFKRGDTFLHQTVQALFRSFQQRLRVTFSRGGDSGIDPPALSADRLI